MNNLNKVHYFANKQNINMMSDCQIIVTLTETGIEMLAQK